MSDQEIPKELVEAVCKAMELADSYIIEDPEDVTYPHQCWEGEAEAAIRAVREFDAQQVCVWTMDWMTGSWDSACGDKWQFMSDGPEENGVRFCQCCGRPVRVEGEA